MRFKCPVCGKWLAYKEGFDVADNDDRYSRYRTIKVTCTNTRCKKFKKETEMWVRVK